MKILITGASGFVGKELIRELIKKGHNQIRVLTRSRNSFSMPGVDSFEWDLKKSYIEDGALDGVDAIIHLAGAGIADSRWTQKRKVEILDSRTKSTELLLNEIKNRNVEVKTFITASAIGFYGNRNDETLDESSSRGAGYLSDVCSNWEDVLLNSDTSFRKCALRTGIVLGKDGGALEKMKLPFLMGVGGKLGSGSQYMSWVHITDLCNMYIELLENEECSGVYNGVAPVPVTNNEFTKVLGSVISRPTVLPVPSFGLKALFGEMSQILLEGQRVFPKRFMDLSFNFKYSNLDMALRNTLGIKSKLKQAWAKF